MTTAKCISFRRALKKQELSHSSINVYFSAISATVTFAVLMDEIKPRPVVGMLHNGEADTKVFTKDYVRAMIKHHILNGDKWMADMIRLSCLTGMRLGKIVALQQ